MSHMLAELGDIYFATNGREALLLAREREPQIIVLDAQLPDMSGQEVCTLLKANVATADIPVIFVTSNDDADAEVSGFAAGASDYVTKPVRPAPLLARVKTLMRLAEATRELRHLSLTDGLTGIANRRRFDDALEQEWRRARRAGTPLSLMLVDVDHFKHFNDRYGHLAGDTCLRRVAELLRDTCQRPGDLAARYGGEEFTLLMPATDRHGACHMAECVIKAMASANIEHGSSPTAKHVTVSVGLASIDDTSADWQHWIGRPEPMDRFDHPRTMTLAADQALYAAKTGGRARAVHRDLVAPPPSTHFSR